MNTKYPAEIRKTTDNQTSPDNPFLFPLTFFVWNSMGIFVCVAFRIGCRITIGILGRTLDRARWIFCVAGAWGISSSIRTSWILLKCKHKTLQNKAYRGGERRSFASPPLLSLSVRPCSRRHGYAGIFNRCNRTDLGTDCWFILIGRTAKDSKKRLVIEMHTHKKNRTVNESWREICFGRALGYTCKPVISGGCHMILNCTCNSPFLGGSLHLSSAFTCLMSTPTHVPV